METSHRCTETRRLEVSQYRLLRLPRLSTSQLYLRIGRAVSRRTHSVLGGGVSVRDLETTLTQLRLRMDHTPSRDPWAVSRQLGDTSRPRHGDTSQYRRQVLRPPLPAGVLQVYWDDPTYQDTQNSLKICKMVARWPGPRPH